MHLGSQQMSDDTFTFHTEQKLCHSPRYQVPDSAFQIHLKPKGAERLLRVRRLRKLFYYSEEENKCLYQQ